MKVKFKKLLVNARMPTYATDGSGCFDLYAADLESCGSTKQAVYDTGLAIQVPKGYTMLVFSRSGHGFMKSLRLANCVGVIDSDYTGPVKIKLQADGKHAPILDMQDAVAQALIIATPSIMFEQVQELDATERGAGGFGSTDKKA